MTRWIACAAWLLLLPGCSSGGGSAPKIPYSGCLHAHNDYEHARPLLDALDAGACSVEADIYLVGTSSLLVAHDLVDVDQAITLQSLYLDPLRAIAAANGGTVLPSGEPLTLLIDVKSEAETTYAVLDGVLAQYPELLTSFSAGTVTDRAVTAIVSGERAQATMAAQPFRWAALDGRPVDLGTGAPVDLIPLISNNWLLHFTWTGGGEMPADQRLALDQLLASARGEGRRLRFWGTADFEEVWRELARADVDLINADDLAGAHEFLEAETTAP